MGEDLMGVRRLQHLMEERQRAHNDSVIKRWLMIGLAILVSMEIGTRIFL